jgi:RND family efflux transporter MFP subunit
MKYLLAFLALLCIGAGGFYLRAKSALDRTEPGRARYRGRPIPVRTASVSESTFDQVIGSTATTEASQVWNVQVGSSDGFRSVEMVVKNVDVVEGEFVTAGKVLFELEDRPFQEIVKQKELALAVARATWDRVLDQNQTNKTTRKIELESAEGEISTRIKDTEARKLAYDTFGKLFDKGYTAVLDYAEAQSQYVLARYAKDEAERRRHRALDAMPLGILQDSEAEAQAKQQLEAAEIGLDVARRNLNRCKITSPIDGYVDTITIIPRSPITLDTPVTLIRKLDPVHLRMDFPQERIDDLHIGQPAEVVLDSLPQETFSGTVIRISSLVNTRSRVLPVVIRVENPDRRLKAGISAFVRLRVKKRAVAAPSLGVIRRESKAMVFRVEDGKARLREIRTGHLLDNGMVEVREGLRRGDEVVVFHNFYRQSARLADGDGLLRDGDAVDVDWHRWASR